MAMVLVAVSPSEIDLASPPGSCPGILTVTEAMIALANPLVNTDTCYTSTRC